MELNMWGVIGALIGGGIVLVVNDQATGWHVLGGMVMLGWFANAIGESRK